MENNFELLHKKVEYLHSQLELLLSVPFDPETSSHRQDIANDICRHLNLIANVVSTELDSSARSDPDGSHHNRLSQLAQRVHRLNTVVRAWTEAKESATTCSESCVVDDGVGDDKGEGEGSYVVGFNVYDNPAFGFDDDDDKNKEEIVENDDDDNVEDEEEDVKEGIIRVDDVVNEMNDDDDDDDVDDDDEGIKKENWQYKMILGVVMMGMGLISLMMVGCSDFVDHHSSVPLLTPT